MIETKPTGKPGWLRRVVGLLIFGSFAVAFTLAVIELIVRVVPLYPDRFVVYDAATGWRHIPNFTGTYLFPPCLGEYHQTVTINSHGLRDVEHSYERTEDDPYRVLLLGDSLTTGFEVPFDVTAFREANVLLNQGSAFPVEIINGGHQGYNTVQSLAFYMVEGRRYQPDLVILLFEPSNDISDNNHFLRTGGSTYLPYAALDEQGVLTIHEGDVSQPDPFKAALNPLHDALYSASNLYRLLYDRATVGRGFTLTLTHEQYAAELDRASQITAALLDELRSVVEADGAAFGVIIAPLNWNRINPSLEAWQWITQTLEEQGIVYRYPQEVFDNSSTGQNLFYTCDAYHWTPSGHALMGTVMTEFITAMHLARSDDTR